MDKFGRPWTVGIAYTNSIFNCTGYPIATAIRTDLAEVIVSAVNEQFEREQESTCTTEAEKRFEETMKANGFVGGRIGESEGKTYHKEKPFVSKLPFTLTFVSGNRITVNKEKSDG